MFKLLLLCLCLTCTCSWAQEEDGRVIDILLNMIKYLGSMIKNLDTRITNVDQNVKKNEEFNKNLGDKVEKMIKKTKLQRREVCFEKRCFRFVDVVQSWPDAEATCVKWGGHLLTITSQKDQDYFMKELKKRKWQWAYIGMNDRAEEGKFVWVGDEESSYVNWHQGEPNNEYDEDCVHIWINNERGGDWNDASCELWKLPSICERMRRDYPNE